MVLTSWRDGCEIEMMGQKTAENRGKPGDPVATYLDARGIPLRKLPPDLLRELTRLLADAPRALMETDHDFDPSLHSPRDLEQEHRHDMVSFEMYLAAWIIRERICDRPKSQPHKRVRRKSKS